jgi:hypothetical protein
MRSFLKAHLGKEWIDPLPCRRWGEGSNFGKRVAFGKNIPQKTKGFLMSFSIFTNFSIFGASSPKGGHPRGKKSKIFKLGKCF